MPPILTNGKVRYIGIPSDDIQWWVDFTSRSSPRGSGNAAMAVQPSIMQLGKVIGTLTLCGLPSTGTDLLVYFIDAIVETTTELVVASGDEIMQSIGPKCSRDNCEVSRPSDERFWSVPGSRQKRIRLMDCEG